MSYATTRAATSPELALFRAGGQWAKLFAAILIPRTIYSARLASLPSTNDRVYEIAFTSGVGVLGDVKKDMMLWVGSTAGNNNLGIARIRKVPIAGTFYIAEESEVLFQADCYLTVVDDFDLWPKHIYIDDDENVFIDRDIAYSDQHTAFDPVPIMGGHRALKLTGASVSTQYNWTNSWVFDSTITSYSCAAPTSSGITGAATSTPTVTFNTTGKHCVYLTVTAANGKSYTGVRYVYVYDNDTEIPADVVDLENCSVDYESGGWSFDMTLTRNATLALVPDRALVILFAEEFYGGTQQSIGALAGCENIVAIGKIAEENLTLHPEQGKVSFRVQGYQYWFGKIQGFPSGLKNVNTTPANWVEMDGLNIPRACYHFLHFRSTATTIMDVYLTDEDRVSPEVASPASNLWQQLKEFTFTQIFANPGIDQYNRLFVEVEPQVIPYNDRNWPSILTLTDADWEPPVEFGRVTVGEAGLIDLSGIAMSALDEASAIFSLSPGHIPRHYGSVEVIDRILLENQSLTNQQAGLLLAWRNNPYPLVPMNLTANNRLLDCFPRQRVLWQLTPSENIRGININNYFIPRRVERQWDPESGFLRTVATFEMATNEEVSANGDVPGSGGADLSVPPINLVPAFPSLPLPPILLPGDITPTTVKVLLHHTTYGFLYTSDFEASVPHWIQVNAGLTPTQYTDANIMFVTPSGAFYVGKVNNASYGNPTYHYIARAPSIGSTFVVLYDRDTINPSPAPGDVWGIFGVGYNPLVAETVAIVMGIVNNNKKIYIGTGGSFAAGAFVDASDSRTGGITYGFGTWLYSRYQHWEKIASGGGSVLASGGTLINPMSLFEPFVSHVEAGTTGKTFHYRSAGPGHFIATNHFASNVETVDANFSGVGFASDPTGMYLMTRYGAGVRGKSSDGGASWATMGSLPVGNWYWTYKSGVGTASQWIAVGGSSVRWSQDFGVVWLGREGNIVSDFPLAGLDMVRVVGAGVQ